MAHPDFQSLSLSELSVLGRVVHLTEEGYEPPFRSSALTEPLLQAPFWLSSSRADAIPEALVSKGLLSCPPSKDRGCSAAHGDSVVPEYAPRDVLLSGSAELAAALRRDAPQTPTDIRSVLVVSEVLSGGYETPERELVELLESLPTGRESSLPLRHILDRLLADGWFFVSGEDDEGLRYGAGARAWSRSHAIHRALASHERLHEALTHAALDSLGVPQEHPLSVAIRRVDRREFVPPTHTARAALGRSVTYFADAMPTRCASLSSTRECATILNLLDITPGERAIVMGPCAAYFAAVASHLVGDGGTVVCLASPDLPLDHQRAAISHAGYGQVVTLQSALDPLEASIGATRWDAVLIHGILEAVPDDWLRLLGERGRMVSFSRSIGNGTVIPVLAEYGADPSPIVGAGSFVAVPYEPPALNRTRMASQQEHPPKASSEAIDPFSPVFVSYSSKDEASCKELVSAFESAGIQCWYSGRNSPIGRDGWRSGIENAIAKAPLAVFLLSEHASNSEHVLGELHNVVSRGRVEKIGVRVRDCPQDIHGDFTFYLKRFQEFDLGRHDCAEIAHAALKQLGRDPPAAAQVDSRGAR